MSKAQDSKGTPGAESLVAEGNAILADLDAVVAREERERTMGSMALSSYRYDMYHKAMGKFHEAYELMHTDS